MKRILLALMMVAIALFAWGCESGSDAGSVQTGTSSNPNPQPTTTNTPNPDPVANLRIINMFGATDGFELQVDEVTIDDDFELVETTPYIELDVATHTVTILMGTDTVFTQQVTLAEGEFKTLVLQGNTNILLRSTFDGIRSQATPEVTGLLLTDNTTPTAGQLNARLVNSTPETEFACSLLTNNDVLLLGPVNAFLATDYSVQNLDALLNATSLVLFFQSTGDTETFVFNEVDGTGGDLIEAIGGQIPASGANATVLTTYDTLGIQYLLIVVDDAASGDLSILSTVADG
jgi:hypothetical protein